MSKLGAKVAFAQGKRLVSRDETDVHHELAKTVVAELGKLKGLPMKVGQILSYMDGTVPDEYRDLYREILGKLCTQSLPMGAESYRAVFEEELGKTPEEVFDSFDDQPIAAASIGQVHRAELDGESLCVKIQYPGIAEATINDLKNMDALMGVMRTIMPNIDTRQMIDDFRTRLVEECDYRREASYQQRFHDLYADDPDIVVPAVYEQLSARRVLTTRFVRGVSLDPFIRDSTPEERDRAGHTLYRFAFEGILHHGIFHADPHPGNFLYRSNDTSRMCVLDFGCVQPVDDEARRDLTALMAAALTSQDIGPHVERAFGITDLDEVSRQMMADMMPSVLAPLRAAQPYQFTRDYVAELNSGIIEAKKKLATRYLTRKSRFAATREGVWFVARTLIGLASIWGTLEPRCDFRALTESLLAGVGDDAA